MWNWLWNKKTFVVELSFLKIAAVGTQPDVLCRSIKLELISLLRTKNNKNVRYIK